MRHNQPIASDSFSSRWTVTTHLQLFIRLLVNGTIIYLVAQSRYLGATFNCFLFFIYIESIPIMILLPVNLSIII